MYTIDRGPYNNQQQDAKYHITGGVQSGYYWIRTLLILRKPKCYIFPYFEKT